MALLRIKSGVVSVRFNSYRHTQLRRAPSRIDCDAVGHIHHTLQALADAGFAIALAGKEAVELASAAGPR